MKTAPLAAVTAVVIASAVTACSPASSSTSASAPATPTTPAPATTTAPAPPTAPAATATAPASPAAGGAGNITIAKGGPAETGPEKLTFTSCGKLTAAQQEQFGTTATAGLTYTFTNGSPGLGAPKVAVNFLDGAAVVASNVTGAGLDPVGSLQKGGGEVDGIGASGQPVTFTSCEVTGYYFVTADGVEAQEYAG